MTAETAAIPEEKPIRSYPLEVPVPLTGEEEKKYGEQLAGLLGERRLNEDKKKQVTKEYSTKISKIQNDIDRIAGALRDGKELRVTDVYDIFHNGVIETRRQFDHCVVSSRAATHDDRQADLFPGVNDGPNGDGKEPEPANDEQPADGEHELDAPAGGTDNVTQFGDRTHHTADAPDDDEQPDDDENDDDGEPTVFTQPGELPPQEDDEGAKAEGSKPADRRKAIGDVSKKKAAAAKKGSKKKK